MMRFFLIGFLLFGAIAFVHGNDDDWGEILDLEIIQTDPQQKKSLESFWDEHFYGSLSGATSFGENHNRLSTEIKLGFNEHWKNFKVVFEGAYRQNTIHTKADIIDSSSGDIISQPTVTLKSEYLELRQAYLNYYPIDRFLFSAGKQIQVWGQLDIFSPIDYMLPMDFSPTGFSLTKADNRMPQISLKIAYYPFDQIEMTGYFFPFFEESSLFSNINYSDFYNTINGVEYPWQKVVPSSESQSSYALRSIIYASFFTMGFTFYNGFNNNFPIFRDKYFLEDGSYYYTTEYGYLPKKGYGFELSVPIGKMNLKFDAALTDEYISVDTFSSNSGSGDSSYDSFVDYNNGYSTIPVYMGFYAAGIDADFDQWFCNFYLMSIQYYKNPIMNDFWSAYDSAYLSKYSSKYSFPSIPIFPTFNIGRYFSTEKKGAYGFALGFFTGSLGVVIYVSNQINESLSWGASLDYIGSFSDRALIAQIGDSNTDGQYLQYKFIEPKLTFGLNYLL